VIGLNPTPVFALQAYFLASTVFIAPLKGSSDGTILIKLQIEMAVLYFLPCFSKQ
jgi:hypothetical protein